jgi:hypothetical protein
MHLSEISEAKWFCGEAICRLRTRNWTPKSEMPQYFVVIHPRELCGKFVARLKSKRGIKEQFIGDSFHF